MQKPINMRTEGIACRADKNRRAPEIPSTATQSKLPSLLNSAIARPLPVGRPPDKKSEERKPYKVSNYCNNCFFARYLHKMNYTR
jgi:hypothetical protein